MEFSGGYSCIRLIQSLDAGTASIQGLRIEELL